MPTKRCLSHVAIAHEHGTRRITRAARGSAVTAPWRLATLPAHATEVRGLASCAPLCAGVTGRRALRGYRGRTETPPAKLSTCATCHYTRALHPRITRAARGSATIARGGSPPSRLAPPRHYPWRLATTVRGLASYHIRTRGAWHRAICTHGALPTRITRAARWGHRALL